MITSKLIQCKFRYLNKEISKVEKEIFSVEKSLLQSKIDLENLKSIQEEKVESLRVMTRALKEEEKKIERAKVCMNFIIMEISTSPLPQPTHPTTTT